MTDVRWIWLPLILSLLALRCVAGNDQLTAIEGTVMDAMAKTPVRKVRVTLQPQESGRKPLVATTDEMGRFRFADIEAGRYRLTAEKSGFLESAYGANRPEGEGSLLKIGGGEKTPDLVLQLFPAGSVSGRVLDADGDPVPDGAVTIFTRVRSGGNMHDSNEETVSTNRAGEYHFDGLAPGTYYVGASGGGSAHLSQPPLAVDSSGKVTKVRDLHTFYSSSTSIAEAQGVRVESGQEQAGIDIRLLRGRLMSLKGRIAGGSGTSKYAVTARSSAGTESAFEIGTVLPNGEFAFTDLPPGTHHLTLMNNAGNSAQAIGETEVTMADQDVTGVVITAFKPAQLRVRVVMEGEEDKPLTSGSVFIVPAQGTEPGERGSSAWQARNGTYELGGVAPGKYRLWFSGAVKAYLKAVQAGGRMLDPQAIDVPEGAEFDLVLMFSRSVATVSGDVEEPREKSDDPLRGVLVPEGLLIDGYVGVWDRAIHWETLDQSRHFLDEDVRPGKYLAFGVRGADYELWSNAEFVKAVRAEGTELEVGERAHGSVHLKVIQKEEIEEIRKRLGL
jgi:hypothetical protein